MMKALTAVFAVVLAGLIAAVPASAAGIEQGSVELVPTTSFSYTSYSPDQGDDLKLTQLRFGGTVGYFFTNIFEMQIGMLVDYTSIDPGGSEGSTSATNTGMGALFVANFATESAAVPFFGAGVSIVGHSGDVGSADKMTVNAPRVVAGVRFFTGSTASINIGVGYEHQSNALGVDKVSGNVVMLEIGVSAFVTGGRGE